MSTALATGPVTRTFTLRKMSDVFDISAPDHVMVPVFDDRTPDVPAIDPLYVFEKDSLKRVLQWLNGSFGKNLLLTGPTGCGKSSIIMQVCARLNIEVFSIGCHGKLEFSEVLGSTQLAPFVQKRNDGVMTKLGAFITTVTKGALDGESALEWLQRCFSTVVSRYVYGAATLAARRGAVLLMDEVNFLHPSTVGAMNTMLDGGPIMIPETGEVVQPASGFRIAVTGNALDGGDDISLHRGVQRMNVALMNRFLAMRCDYMSKLQEYEVLQRVGNLPSLLIDHMTTIAAETRAAYKAGAIETTISTRVMIRWARLLAAQRSQLAGPDAVEMITNELRFALLDGASVEDGTAILTLLKKTTGESPAYVVNAQQPTPVDLNKSMHVNLYVNPNYGQPKYWGSIVQSETTEVVFFEACGTSPTTQPKQTGYVQKKASQKVADGYRQITFQAPLPNASENLNKLLVDTYRLLQNGSVASLPDPVMRDAMIQIANVLERADWLTRITN